MKTIIKHISIIGIIFAFSHAIAVDSLYPSNIQDRLDDVDKDGVIDARDLCTDTQIGFEVDNNGCPNTTNTLLSVELNVLFASGKSDISLSFYPELKEFATFLQNHPDVTVVIEGHTDNKGSEEFNRVLSQKRAKAIADVLVDRFRIKPNRIKGIGYGETRPINSNLTEEGRSKNRRVVAQVYAQQQLTYERWTIFSVDRNLNTALNRNY